MGGFSAVLNQFDGVAYVEVRGVVDFGTEADFRDTIRRAHGHILVNCESLEFIDSRGLSVLVEASLLHGPVALHRPSVGLMRMIDALDFRALFTFEAPSLVS
jgi:anti-anti-sigma factor